MDHSQRATNGETSNATSAPSNLMPNVLFREIHKNAFLKRHSSDRRAGFPRKSERVWVVFCVHDDIEPFLEIYPDQKVALTHKPEWFASLSNVLHVSPTICGHEDEYEFAITLSFQVVRLSAPSWESMMEWVETIRNKLRELKVLCPKENVYSKMPEQKQPLLPTRDPNSPLPLPPEGPSTLLPGVELVHVESRPNLPQNDSHENGRHQRSSHFRNNEPERRALNKRVNHAERDLNAVVEPARPSEGPSSSGGNENTVEGSIALNANLQASKLKVRRAANASQASTSTSGVLTPSNITVIEVSTPSHCDSNVSECNESNEVSIQNSRDSNEGAAAGSNPEEMHYEPVFLASVPTGKTQFQSPQCKASVNCISVNGNKSKKTHSTSLLIEASSSNQNSSQEKNIPRTSNVSLSNNVKEVFVSNQSCSNAGRNAAAAESELSDNGPLSPQIQSKLEKVNISGLIPRVPAKSQKISSFKPASPTFKDLNLNVLESKKYSENGPASAVESTDAITNGECSRAASTSGVSMPAYSQVKKVPKGKLKSEEHRNEEHQKASPLVPRRKPNEIQVSEIESQANRKPESVSVSISNSSEAKTSNHVGLKPSESSRQGGGSSETSRNLAPVPSSEQRNLEASGAAPSTSGSTSQVNLNRKESFKSPSNAETEPIIAIVQPPVGVISVEDIPLIGGHQRRRRRSSSSDPAPTSNVSSARGIGGADRIRINVPNNSSREAYRNESEIGPTCQNRNAMEPNPQINVTSQSSRLTLREKQVLQLKKEMLHPGGVRLQLRRKDCTGSIALVDVLNGVWVAGWKQKEHPLLYNALHIGDQLISIGDVLVRNSTEAQKLIRSSTSLYIEFIIRRVPFGNVFALQRSSEGQSLGIIQEGNTAEIKGVVPNSVAARQGLTSKTPSCDGLSLTTWFLTEINGRPLNLFFKDNEVKDRLNAVGKEISILVQPHDFIKQVKKQLKNIRGYKEYIVQ